MFQWYKKVISNYANFNGRARRSEFWYFTLCNLIFLVVAAILDNVLGINMAPLPYGAIYCLYALFAFLPGLAVQVRRLHDLDKSGWMILIVLIPIIGAIWLLVLLCTEGTRGENRFGPDPKNEGGSFDFDKNQFAQ